MNGLFWFIVVFAFGLTAGALFAMRRLQRGIDPRLRDMLEEFIRKALLPVCSSRRHLCLEEKDGYLFFVVEEDVPGGGVDRSRVAGGYISLAYPLALSYFWKQLPCFREQPERLFRGEGMNVFYLGHALREITSGLRARDGEQEAATTREIMAREMAAR